MKALEKILVCWAFAMCAMWAVYYFSGGGGVSAAPSVSYEELTKLVQNNKDVNDVIYKRLVNVEKQVKAKVPKELDIIQWVEPGKQ